MTVRKKVKRSLLPLFILLLSLAVLLGYLGKPAFFTSTEKITSYEEAISSFCEPHLAVGGKSYTIDIRKLPFSFDEEVLDIDYKREKFKLFCDPNTKTVLIPTNKSQMTGITLSSTPPDLRKAIPIGEYHDLEVAVVASPVEDINVTHFPDGTRSDHDFGVDVGASRSLTLPSGEKVYLSILEIFRDSDNEELKRLIDMVEDGKLLIPAETVSEDVSEIPSQQRVLIYKTYRYDDINKLIQKRLYGNVNNLREEEKQMLELIETLFGAIKAE